MTDAEACQNCGWKNTTVRDTEWEGQGTRFKCTHCGFSWPLGIEVENPTGRSSEEGRTRRTPPYPPPGR